jgi:hypothetical protein
VFGDAVRPKSRSGRRHGYLPTAHLVYALGGVLLNLDGATPPELRDQVMQVERTVHAEVRVAAGTVRREAPDRLASDHEPVGQIVHCLRQRSRHDVRGSIPGAH